MGKIVGFSWGVRIVLILYSAEKVVGNVVHGPILMEQLFILLWTERGQMAGELVREIIMIDLQNKRIGH